MKHQNFVTRGYATRENIVLGVHSVNKIRSYTEKKKSNIIVSSIF